MPDVDVHFHGQEFFNQIQALSNATDCEGNPLFVSDDFSIAKETVQKARRICREHGAETEFRIEIELREMVDEQDGKPV